MNHAGRLNALRTGLTAPLLVSRLTNLQYLTGFTGSNGFLVVRPGGARRPSSPTAGTAKWRRGWSWHSMTPISSSTRPDCGMCFVMPPPVSARSRSKPTASCGRLLPTSVERRVRPLLPVGGAVEKLRRTKDAEEIAALTRAAAAGDFAFSSLGSLAKRTISEAEARLESHRCDALSRW